MKQQLAMIKKAFKRSMSPRRAPVLDFSTISQLIYEQDWQSLLFVVGSQRSDGDWLATTTENAQDTMLHMCCRFQPPLCVICAIYRLNPLALEQADENGRFPIHLACFHGAKFEVIEFLVRVSSELAVEAQDRTGKTPLHLICEHYHYKRHPQWEDWQGSRVVKMLCGKAPDIINIEDDEGRTAVEMVIDFLVPFKVVKTLQKASAADWKARRQGQQSHEVMQNDFKRQTSDRRLDNDSFSDLTASLSRMSLMKIDSEDDDEPRVRMTKLSQTLRRGTIRSTHAA